MVPFWLRAVLASAVGVWLPDMLWRPPAAAHERAGYALFAVASVGLWYVVLDALSRLRTRFRRTGLVAAWVVGAAAALAATVFFSYRATLGVDPPSSAVALAARYPHYAVALAQGSAGTGNSLALAVLPVLSAAAVGWLSRPDDHRPARRNRWIAWLSVLAGLGATLAAPAVHATADLRGVAELARGGVTLMITPVGLPEAARLGLASAHPRHAPDVLLVIHESVAADVVFPWGGDPGCSPGIAGLVQEHDETSVVFTRASASAGCTNVSVPSILSGLAPDATRQDYARAPLLWHYARSLGYRTALFTAQDYEGFANFDGFLIGEDPPDVAITASSFPDVPRVNDGGVDDALVADAASAFIQASDPAVPLFVVLQLNASHGPGFFGDLVPRSDLPGRVEGRIERAIRYADAAATRVVRSFAQAGRSERLLVVSTADHGEAVEPGRPPRVENLDEGVARVPLWVRLPPTLVAAAPGWLDGLRANALARVGNIDIAPTLLEVWGLPAPESFEGVSLLNPISRGRRLVSVNTVPIRGWDRTALAVFYGHDKWRVDETGAFLFDLERDPTERHNLFASAPEAKRRAFLADVASRPSLRATVLRLSPAIAAELP